MIGISSLNGLSLPIDERFARMKAAGFESILLWWGADEQNSRATRVAFAKKHGLYIENAHATTDNLNALWSDGDAGDHTLSELKREIADCSRWEIGTLVVHLTNGNEPPSVSGIGISRIEQLIQHAENAKIRLAFENVRKPEHIQYVLDHYTSAYVGLCYDSGHEYLWSPGVDWLKEYGTRVFAIHLHDNTGDKDTHLVPFDGMIDWSHKVKQLAESSYTGTITIESEIHSSNRYDENGFDSYLSYAYESGKKLAELIRAHRERLNQSLTMDQRSGY